MKVAIIGTVGIPAKYGGFETLAENLVKELGGEFSFLVYCSSPHYKIKKKRYQGSELKYLPFSANGKSSILYDVLSIIHGALYADVLLILGVSGAFMIPIIRAFTKKKIITNIDGIEWKRDKWGPLAKKYLKKQEKIAVKYSHDLVVDNQGIMDYVSTNYGKPSTLVAYGASHTFKEELKQETKVEYNIPAKYAFKVCRIEPENNIHLILKAFSLSKMNLVIVGNWNNSSYGTELKEEFKSFDNISLLDPIYNQQKLNELRGNCQVYVHGHSAGGTNPSLVEAMYLQLPIIAFDVEYNRHTTLNKALYFDSEEELITILNNEHQNYELDKIAFAMKSIANEHYTWQAICKSYRLLFED